MGKHFALSLHKNSLPLDIQQAIREERLAQREIGLANSLRGMGTGVKPSLWDKLNELSIPVHFNTGH